MANPQRKSNHDVDPEIRPRLGVINGGGESTPERGDLSAVDTARDLNENERKFGVINGGGESTPERGDLSAVDANKNIDNVRDDESLGGNHINNFTGGNTPGKMNIKGLGKRKSMVAFLISIFAIGGISIGGFFGVPGLLIVNIAEVMTEKFDVQLGSMNVRYGKIVQSKVSNTTSGICTSPITIQCKYGSLSDKQIKKFKLAGIEVQHTGGTTFIRGQTKPTMFVFEGKEIPAPDFAKEARTNMKFRAALKQSYNPKLAGFADKVFAKAAAKIKITKSAPFAETDNTDEKRTVAVQDQTKNGADASSGRILNSESRKPDGSPYTETEIIEHNRGVEESNAIGDEAQRVANGGMKAGDIALAAGTNVIKVTGAADTACMVYGMINAVSYGAKAIRAAQMARYAWIFLKTASMIKAGEARPGDVTYAGNILTKVTKKKPKSATDSDGYLYASNMRTGPVGNNATQYLSGGGLGGQFVDVLATINATLNNNPKGTCKTLANPFVQVGSFLAGIALFLVPGGQPIQAAKLVGMATIAIVTAAAVAVLPGMLADLTAGVLVDPTTGGEDSGNIITSGSAVAMGTVANWGGNAPMTPAQAAAYENGVLKGALEEHAQEDRIAHSPLDPMSKNTFMGQLYTKLVPHTSQIASLTGILNTSASLVGSSLSTIASPASKAATAEDFTHCQDEEYKRLGIATDPFCNPVYGLPMEYLDLDPIEVTNRLADQIDPETGYALPGSEYETFVKDCMERDRPLGDSGQDFTLDDGSKCLINESNADYYVHAVDQRILDGMDNGYNDGVGLEQGETTPTGPSENSGNVNPNGWSFPTLAGAPLKQGFHDGHTALDIGGDPSDPNIPIYAVRDGTVVSAGNIQSPWIQPCNPNGTIQQVVVIKHTVGATDYYSAYHHVSTSGITVTRGSTVKAGDRIATMGNTGCSFGQHLHFELWQAGLPASGGFPVNPGPFWYNNNSNAPVPV